jgi:hypothetical protein
MKNPGACRGFSLETLVSCGSGSRDDFARCVTDLAVGVHHRKRRYRDCYEERDQKQQTQAARLSAPKGEVKLDSHDLSAWGGVEVHSDDGTVLYTEQLMFSSSQQKILSQSPVKIVRNDSIVIGEGLEATPDLSEVKIFRHEASISPRKIKLK